MSYYSNTTQKDLRGHRYSKQNFGMHTELDHVSIEIESYEHYEVGEDVVYDKKQVTVVSKEILCEKGEVKKRYTL